MPATKYGRSPWIEEFPKSRVPSYPQWRGDGTADAVIIGGGLTGCTTAYALSAAGARVILLEAERIGRGSTGFGAGWITEDPGVSFADVEKLHGVRAARRGWHAWRRAALDFSALVRRLQIKCYLEPKPAAIVAMTPEESAWIKREQKSRRDAGLDAPALTARALRAEFGAPAIAGVRIKDGATIDPYRATIGLAAAAAARGAQIFERAPVRNVTFDRKIAYVHAASGAIRARRVVVATGAPTQLYKALARHFWFRTAYAALTEPVPAKLRRQLGARRSVLRDAADPPHVVRWVDDERLLVCGADQATPSLRQRSAAIVQRTGQLMYELSLLYPEISGIQPAYGWAAPYGRTADGLPYIGPHRNFPHHVFAWGGTGPASAFLASRIALRQISGELDPADEAFGFLR